MLVSALLKLDDASAAPAISIAKGVFMLPTALSGSRIMSGSKILATKQMIPRTIEIIAGEQSCFKTSFSEVFPLIIITHETRENAIKKAIEKINATDYAKVEACIRVEE